MSIRITLPDGSERAYEGTVTGYDIASDIGPRLAKAAVAVTVNGDQFDLHRAIEDDAAVSIITENTEAGRHVIRHSAAHIMAQAVLDLFPGSSFAIGPAIEDGFYYDFSVERPFTPDDLDRIGPVLEKRCHQLGEILRVVFEIGILEDDEIPSRGLDAGAHGGPFALVHIVMEDPHPVGVLGSHCVDDLCAAVGGSIVDDDDLELTNTGNRDREQSLEHLADEIALVENRHDGAQVEPGVAVKGLICSLCAHPFLASFGDV